jgi:hypothetical protein
MTAILSRPAWTIDFEIATFNHIIAQYAPHIPLQKQHEPRPPLTDEELNNFHHYRVAGAAHDLFIVQLCARAIERLFRSDPDVQLFLSRQIGDDGIHALDTRQRIQALSGYDPIEEIQAQVQRHRQYLDDLPTRNWLAFLAWELHYELHIVAILLLNSRLTQINDPASAQFATERILPDEFAHRAGIAAWWQREYDHASPGQRSELAAGLLELDEEIQR